MCVVDTTNLREYILGLVLRNDRVRSSDLLVLNMMDATRRRGIRLILKSYLNVLGVPVVETVAVRNAGIENLLHAP